MAKAITTYRYLGSYNGFNRGLRTEYTPATLEGVFANVKGMEYGAWISESPRSSGTPGDLITNPAYMIESLIRDFFHRQNDIICSAYSTANNTLDFDGASGYLDSGTDDFYNNAYLHSVTKDWVKKVTDYDGTNKRITVASLTAGEMEATASDNNFYITNVNCALDYPTFDAAATARSGWDFNGSIYEEIDAEELLTTLLYESHCILSKNYDGYQLHALDAGSTTGTLTTPLKIDGVPQITVGLTPLSEIYTSYTLKFLYDYSLTRTKRTVKINSQTDNSGDTTFTSGTNYRTKCQNAIDNHRINNAYTSELLFISEKATAQNLTKKLIEWHTERRLVVDWYGNIKDHITYEIGDQVLINYSHMIPTGKNNSAKFIIIGKTIVPSDVRWGVKLNLIELPS